MARLIGVMSAINRPGTGPDMEHATKDFNDKLNGLEANNVNGITGFHQSQDTISAPIAVAGIGPGKVASGVVVPGVDKPKIKLPVVQPHADVPPELTSGDPAQVRSLLQAQKGRVEACVQTQLAQDPNLDGRLTLSWELEAGKAGRVVIEGNSTGNKAIETCFINSIKRMNFAELSGTVDSFSWVVSGK
jgi:hypothetical protein